MNPSSQPDPQPTTAPMPPQPNRQPAPGPQLIQDIPVRRSEAAVAPKPASGATANPISSAANPFQQDQAKSLEDYPKKAAAPKAAATHKSHLALVIFTAVAVCLLLAFMAFLVFRQG